MYIHIDNLLKSIIWYFLPLALFLLYGGEGVENKGFGENFRGISASKKGTFKLKLTTQKQTKNNLNKYENYSKDFEKRTEILKKQNTGEYLTDSFMVYK